MFWQACPIIDPEFDDSDILPILEHRLALTGCIEPGVTIDQYAERVPGRRRPRSLPPDVPLSPEPLPRVNIEPMWSGRTFRISVSGSPFVMDGAVFTCTKVTNSYVYFSHDGADYQEYVGNCHPLTDTM